jgi:nicotinic acid phosphoribosyltransferase
MVVVTNVSYQRQLQLSSRMRGKQEALSVHMQAVAYGMGGGLLQRLNRDTMQFATKLCHIVYADGSQRDIAKMPKSDAAKTVCICQCAQDALVATL